MGAGIESVGSHPPAPAHNVFRGAQNEIFFSRWTSERRRKRAWGTKQGLTINFAILFDLSECSPDMFRRGNSNLFLTFLSILGRCVLFPVLFHLQNTKRKTACGCAIPYGSDKNWLIINVTEHTGVHVQKPEVSGDRRSRSMSGPGFRGRNEANRQTSAK